MDEASKAALGTLLRAALLIIGTLLTTHGVVKETEWATYSGAITMIAPIIWGMWQKYRSELRTQARERVAMNAGISLANGNPEAVTPPVLQASVPAVIRVYQSTEGQQL